MHTIHGVQPSSITVAYKDLKLEYGSSSSNSFVTQSLLLQSAETSCEIRAFLDHHVAQPKRLMTASWSDRSF